jgi:seryl-tRNA synthetase
LSKEEPLLKKLTEELNGLMMLVPNVVSDDTPIGKDEEDNKVVRSWGTQPKFAFTAKNHVELGTSLDLLDLERGVKVSGFRGYYLKNNLVQLQWALFQYCLNLMQEKGFDLMVTPTLVREPALVGSGHFPEAKEEIYPVGDNFLVGTSEPSLLAYRAGEVLDEAEMPLKLSAVSPCYRREIGNYGKDTKGLYRVHEFWKVEQVVICANDLTVSLKLFEEMLAIAEEVLQKLELPYRVVQICTGDMGSGKYKMYDIETWMPSRDSYGETHSCSHLTSWQARRLNLRYRNKEGELVYPHTMNNTVIATPRILIALLENNQQKDGSIVIPKVLRPFMGKKKKLGK